MKHLGAFEKRARGCEAGGGVVNERGVYETDEGFVKTCEGFMKALKICFVKGEGFMNRMRDLRHDSGVL